MTAAGTKPSFFLASGNFKASPSRLGMDRERFGSGDMIQCLILPHLQRHCFLRGRALKLRVPLAGGGCEVVYSVRSTAQLECTDTVLL